MCFICDKSPLLKTPVSMVLCETDPRSWNTDRVRLYEVKEVDLGAYYSSWSGGQEHYTKDAKGPGGESIHKRIKYILSEGYGFIGGFETWEDLRHFILGAMLCTIHEVVA